jgi:hypothetical protein
MRDFAGLRTKGSLSPIFAGMHTVQHGGSKMPHRINGSHQVRFSLIEPPTESYDNLDPDHEYEGPAQTKLDNQGLANTATECHGSDRHDPQVSGSGFGGWTAEQHRVGRNLGNGTRKGSASKYQPSRCMMRPCRILA